MCRISSLDSASLKNRAFSTILLLPVAACFVSACGGASPPPPTNTPPVAKEVVEATPADDGRWHHFWIIRQAVNAVIEGDLNKTQALLAQMADGDFGEEMQPDWTVWVGEMQDEAVVAGRTQGLDRVAERVAAIATRCADCHRMASGGPEQLSQSKLEQMAHVKSSTKPANENHRWAVDELWIGMTIPLHQAWVSGARELIDSPLHKSPPAEDEAAEEANAKKPPPSPAKPPPSTFDLLDSAAAVDVRPRAKSGEAGVVELARVGERLLKEGQPLPMAKAFGNYIARCSGCHSEH